jgi:mannose/fructose-specific phosphotransferase system component IIA
LAGFYEDDMSPWVLSREKKEIERKPSTDFEILLMTDG